MKEIPGYKGRYKITEDGRVWSAGKTKGTVGRPHQPSFKKNYLSTRGYPIVTLSLEGLEVKYYVHRLVALCYLPPAKALQIQVNHKDGNKLNNHYSNLEWCTASENMLHAHRVLGKKSNLGSYIKHKLLVS